MKKFENLKVVVEVEGLLLMEFFMEDWNESQFWVWVYYVYEGDCNLLVDGIV